MLEKTYTRDEFVALLGGSMALPGDLEELPSEARPDVAPGIWWAKVDDADLQGLTPEELLVLRPHPNDRPTTEPLLPFPFFTARQFVAFADCVRGVLDLRDHYLVGDVTWGRALDEKTKTRWPVSVRWIGVKEDLVAQLRARSRHAPDLVAALLNSPAATTVESADGPGVAPLAESPRPVQRQRAQEAAVLTELRKFGYDPQALPMPARRGLPSAAKQAVRAALPYSVHVLDKTWKRLRKSGGLKDAT